jgi:hypothetical protein
LTGAVRGNAGDGRLRWTSVPRWPPGQLPAAASYLVCCFGDAGERRAAELLARAEPAAPVRTARFAARWHEESEAELRRLIDDCFTGVRIILAGPEAAVMRAAAVARQLGAVNEELVLTATEVDELGGPAGKATGSAAADASGNMTGNAADASGNAVCAEDAAVARSVGAYVAGTAARRVFCADCRVPFDAFAALGDVVTCPGCAAALTVDHRFSRAHAAYFGWPAGLDLHR